MTTVYLFIVALTILMQFIAPSTVIALQVVAIIVAISVIIFTGHIPIYSEPIAHGTQQIIV
jgi:hypothetical protein